MGSIPLDNGESVYTHDGTGSADPVAISAAEGSNLANLMKNRERFDYTWADSAERTAQTGMVQGSRGYQEDSKTEYTYDSSQWRLALPYIEFSAGSQALSASTRAAQTGWSLDATRSTDSTMVTVSGGVFTFVKAGIYAFACTGSNPSPGANAYQSLTTDVGFTHLSVAGYTAQVGTLTVPFYRITADGTPLYLWAHNDTAVSITDRRVRIGRLG